MTIVETVCCTVFQQWFLFWPIAEHFWRKVCLKQFQRQLKANDIHGKINTFRYTEPNQTNVLTWGSSKKMFGINPTTKKKIIKTWWGPHMWNLSKLVCHQIVDFLIVLISFSNLHTDHTHIVTCLLQTCVVFFSAQIYFNCVGQNFARYSLLFGLWGTAWLKRYERKNKVHLLVFCLPSKVGKGFYSY